MTKDIQVSKQFEVYSEMRSEIYQGTLHYIGGYTGGIWNDRWNFQRILSNKGYVF